MSHYVYFPSDIANFFLLEDITREEEWRVFSKILSEESEYIGTYHREHPEDYWREIRLELSRDHTDRDKLVGLFRGVDDSIEKAFPSDDLVSSRIAEEFKALRLYLLFGKEGEKRPFVKMKLRTLLRIFGYKRRTRYFVKEAQEIKEELGIETYLKGNKKCDFGEITINDMFIFRVKSDKKHG